MHNAFQGDGPVRPGRSALAVHNVWRPQRAVSAQLCCAPVNEGPVAKDDLILIPWCSAGPSPAPPPVAEQVLVEFCTL